MIQPRNPQEIDYVQQLASHRVRGKQAAARNDKAADQTFSQAHRDLVEIGAKTFGNRNTGLVEWAATLSREDPLPESLVTYMAKQQVAAQAKPVRVRKES